MLLKTVKIRADALYKSVYLLPWPMPCLIKTGNTLTGSTKMFSLGLISTKTLLKLP